MSKPKESIGIGVMSGTSLDGMDLALCKFNFASTKYEYEILSAQTISYDDYWTNKLNTAQKQSGEDLMKLNNEFGQLIAFNIERFIQNYNYRPEFIASHGHTIFHQPKKKFTFQIGAGAVIAAKTQIPTICDFRSIDIALQGQGAPLVPVGDELLFNSYDSCLNLGGFANISFKKNNERIAYDICPINIALNYFSNKLGFAYDKNGDIAKGNEINPNLLADLNRLSYYHELAPKSLGREWFENTFISTINKQNLTNEAIISTITEHAAVQISKALHCQKNVLITGGGAMNKHLINRIKFHSTCQINIPDELTINFKEALIFSFLGYLRINNIVNTYKSSTGASKNSIGGCIYLP